MKSQLVPLKAASSGLLFSTVGWLSLTHSTTAIASPFDSTNDSPFVSQPFPVEIPTEAIAPTTTDHWDVIPVDSWIEERSPEDPPLAQLTSVSQLSDVQPSDWAFQALQTLIERYGCIAGYPDGTFRGNRPVTRFEFAAGLNACLEQINQLIQSAAAQQEAIRADLQTMTRLQQDFALELATLRGRLDNLETRQAELEANQFSTTTKLFGQVIFGLQGRSENEADFFPVDGDRETPDPATNVTLIQNVQMSLFTQLNPRSVLLTSLQGGNGTTAPRLSNDTRLGYEADSNNLLTLTDLNYRQLLGFNFAFIVGPAGVNMANVFRGANRAESAGHGPISAFAQRNPIANIGSGRGGVGFDWQITPRASLQTVYSASTPAEPVTGGLFGGSEGETTLGMQLTLVPFDTVDVALNYVNAYSPLGRLGTGVGDDQLTVDSELKTNAVGATLSWRITPRLTLGTWGGYTNSRIPGRSGNVETTNWMVFLNYSDLLNRGDLAGIYVGQPPKIVSSDLPVGKNIPDLLAGGMGEPGEQPGTTTHIEAFYRFQLTDNMSLTPGVLVILEPGQTPDSDSIVVGVLRTTFNF